jgi:hypothetical protein
VKGYITFDVDESSEKDDGGQERKQDHERRKLNGKGSVEFDSLV